MTSFAAARDAGSFSQTMKDHIASTAEYYEVHAKEYFDRTVSADLSQLYDPFLACVPTGGRILDAGCGSGRDLRHFRERGFEAIGIDASPTLVRIAQEYSGAPCHILRFEDMRYKRRFDGVWACASLLHLSKLAVVPVLERFRHSLIPGGVMFASVQIGEGEGLVADGRFYTYYKSGEFLRLVQSAKFAVERSWITEDALPGRSTINWINVLARR